MRFKYNIVGKYLLTEQQHVVFDNKLSELYVMLESTAVLTIIYSRGMFNRIVLKRINGIFKWYALC